MNRTGGSITRRDMLKTSSAALAGLAGLPLLSPHSEAAPVKQDLTRYVDPFIGTGAHGHTFPGATVPFGMVQLSPDNGVNGWDWSSGYHWTSDRIAGFSHTHLSGTGIGDMYDFLLMPTLSGRVTPSDFSSRFSHEYEAAAPGYYAVELLDTGIAAELTATERVGFHRYTFKNIPGGRAASIVVDLGHSLNWDRPTDTTIGVDGPSSISGYRHSTGWARDQRLFFTAEFSRPIAAHWLESESVQADARTTLRGTRVRACFQFHLEPGERILAKVAISPVSVAGARRNLALEVPGWDFDATRGAAKDAWNRALSRIEITTSDDDQKIQFYTALYHALLAPHLFCDVDGAYRGPDGEIHLGGDFANYTVFSLWDTFRAEHPLLTLLQPDRVDDLIRAMIAFYREGGLLPVWSLAGNETNTMIGYHSVPVILDAWAKGLTSVDPEEALQAMKKSATQDAHGLRFYRLPEPMPLAEARAAESQPNLRPVGSIERRDLASLGGLCNGYAASGSGGTIGYHSPYPTARSALLVRTDGRSAPIEWATGPAPASAASDPVSFVWLAGIDAGQRKRRFQLVVNGQPWFDFTGPTSGATGFRARGPRGATLHFKATHIDQYDDLFGFMFLTLDAGAVRAGERLQLRVEAEDAGTQDWYMTFEHPVTARVSAENVYGFVTEDGQRRQIVHVDVEHLGAPAEATIFLGDGPPARARARFGHTRVALPAPLVEQPTPIPVRVEIAGAPALQTELLLRPVRPYGYIPADWESESVSKTLEYAYDDWCIAELAESLGRPEDARAYRERAHFYRNVFDESTGFMRGRLSDGSWRTPFSPLAASHRQAEYTEGNAWQYSWFAPHDVGGLIELMGGREAFIAKLDELFEQSSDPGPNAPPDISGMIGQYAHGNEPSHHIAYLYAYAGAPWKTQERVRQITERLYGTGPDGLPGNEDCGQMSAWLILSTIGFYPVNPADGNYVIGAPHFEYVSVALEGGKTFTVEAAGVSAVKRYVQSVTLNGRPLDRCYITHDEIVAGGRLAVEMGSTPNRSWAITKGAAPPSMSDR